MPGVHDTFNELYAKLNPEQREAVDAIEGPVMVVAGPGTGKTQILTLRIANIMRRTDVPPSAILALTFTNAAAANMRSRLVSIVGSEGYRVSIFTFHSFAHHVIDAYPERFPELVGASTVSEVEQLDLVRQLVTSGPYSLLKPLGDPYHHVVAIQKAIGHLKKEGMGPAAFQAWVDRQKEEVLQAPDLCHTKGPHAGKRKVVYEKLLASLAKDEELAHVFARYEDALRMRKRYDFDDSVLALAETLGRDESFLRELQETYQYLLVDEHQDTNGAQNKILEQLAHYFEEPNLFVVGDEKQAIFRFQGASLANFLYFERIFRNVRRITLSRNYRSHQGILDAAHDLIGHARQGIPAPLIAVGGERRAIDVYRLGAEDEELLFLAETVRLRLTEGVPAHEIAVLVRTNRDLGNIREYFERLNIPCIVESGHGVLDDPDIRALNTILYALADLENDDVLARMLFIDFLDISLLDTYALIAAAREHHEPLLRTLTRNDVVLERPASVAKLASLLTTWRRRADNEPFLECFEAVVRESGLLAHIERSPYHVEKFDKIVRLFDEIKAHVLRDPYFGALEYRTFLEILKDHHVVLEAKSRHVVEAVRMMTVHKAKGLEFDYVFIPYAVDGHWGGRRPRSTFLLPYSGVEAPGEAESVEDERRLFYVALTRARKQAAISYASRAPDGKERVPCQFIEEIPDALKKEWGAEDVGVANKRPPLFVVPVARDERDKYVRFVRLYLDRRGLSATALNSYLTCPWVWFYHHFFHAQFVKTVHQKRGTAVHGALQAYFNRRNQVPDLEVSFLLREFETRLEREGLEADQYERVCTDTGAALTGWHARYAATWPRVTQNELRVEVLCNGLKLTGSLDKLECPGADSLQSCREVNIVDYKTGKPKTRNEIEGKTKAKGAGHYKRQLVFYTLLLARYRDGCYRPREAVLDFVEPNDRGVYKKESFSITPEERSELEETIARVAEEVRTLAFWSGRCDDATCEACALRDMMEKDR